MDCASWSIEYKEGDIVVTHPSGATFSAPTFDEDFDTPTIKCGREIVSRSFLTWEVDTQQVALTWFQKGEDLHRHETILTFVEGEKTFRVNEERGTFVKYHLGDERKILEVVCEIHGEEPTPRCDIDAKAASMGSWSAGEGVLDIKDLVVTSDGDGYTITHQPTATKVRFVSCYGYGAEVYKSVELSEIDGCVVANTSQENRVDHEGTRKTVNRMMTLELEGGTTLVRQFRQP